MNRKGLIANIVTKDDGQGPPTFSARITTPAVDRDNEVLLPAGMSATDFKKNPVIFWNHDYDQPIGKCTKLTSDGDHWIAQATLSATDPRAKQVHGLMKEDIVKGVSVGFIPIEARNPTSKDKELFGDHVEYIYSKWKLLEFSVTPLPANQDALVTGVSKMVNGGVMTPAQAKALCGVDIDVSRSATNLDTTDLKAAELAELKRVLQGLQKRKAQAPRQVTQAQAAQALEREMAKQLGFGSVASYRKHVTDRATT